MEIILKDKNNKSRNHYAFKTEGQIHDACIPYDINTKERHMATFQNINNKQKLFDFISDKNKLSLNTYFDHKGTKDFLIGKNEAMRKIELDEKIELVQKKSEKMKKGCSNPKKKLSKQQSAGFSLKRSSKKSLKMESSKNIKLKKKHNSLSTKNLIDKHNFFKEKFVHFDLKEHSDDYRIIKSPAQIPKKKKSSLVKKKNKKNLENEKINIDKSINSINTVDSKLFNNENEYNTYKYFLTKDDEPILEDILYELDLNNK